MRQKICLLIFLVVSAAELKAQYNPGAGQKRESRIFYGGGGGFGGGTEYLNISVTPMVGYKVTEQFATGLQTSFQYVRWFGNSINNYGGGPFVQYSFSEKLFAYSQYEYLNFGFFPPGQSEPERAGFSSLFVGGGYVEPLGDRAAFVLMALYNLLYGDGYGTPYVSPLHFRVGFVVGLF